MRPAPIPARRPSTTPGVRVAVASLPPRVLVSARTPPAPRRASGAEGRRPPGGAERSLKMRRSLRASRRRWRRGCAEINEQRQQVRAASAAVAAGAENSARIAPIPTLAISPKPPAFAMLSTRQALRPCPFDHRPEPRRSPYCWRPLQEESRPPAEDGQVRSARIAPSAAMVGDVEAIAVMRLNQMSNTGQAGKQGKRRNKRRQCCDLGDRFRHALSSQPLRHG